jgi:hypothetical protein
MNGSILLAPIVRDVGHWSAHARMWSLTTARFEDHYQAVSCGARLEGLEALAAGQPSRSTSDSMMTFFRLPEKMKAEALSLDPPSLFRPEENDEPYRFIERFAEYLEFLGWPSALRARACVVAPAQVSRRIVCPFDEPEVADGDTLVCCNLSEVPARIALRAAALVPGEGDPTDAIALSLDAGDCVVCTRSWMLGYLPDEQGEPTFWFEGLVKSRRSIAISSGEPGEPHREFPQSADARSASRG